jgi:hypothetical protein
MTRMPVDKILIGAHTQPADEALFRRRSTILERDMGSSTLGVLTAAGLREAPKDIEAVRGPEQRAIGAGV